MMMSNKIIRFNIYTDTTKKIEATFNYKKINNKLIGAKVMIGTGIACYIAGAVNVLIGFGSIIYGSKFDYTPHFIAFGAGFIVGTPLIISGIVVKAKNMGKLRRHYNTNTSYFKVNVSNNQIGLVYKF
jgi:hypothetical protein